MGATFKINTSNAAAHYGIVTIRRAAKFPLRVYSFHEGSQTSDVSSVERAMQDAEAVIGHPLTWNEPDTTFGPDVLLWADPNVLPVTTNEDFR